MTLFSRGVAAIALSLVLGLSACASIGDGEQALPAEIADRVVTVDTKYRPLRVCLMAAGVVEVMTDRIQYFDSSQAPESLGRLMALESAVSTARLADPLWLNTDMADVSILLAAVLHDAGREKLGRVLSGRPSLNNFLDVAHRATLLAVKGDAILLDINSILGNVADGILEEDDAWRACYTRIEKNRELLRLLSGA